jgi:hypothetical protein
MRAYTVHAPPGEPAPERFVLVKDGFSWPAFFFPILWILWHRMWLTLIGAIIFVLVIMWIGRLAGDAEATIFAITGALLIGLEGNAIRRLSLENRGWREIGETFGRNLTEAEIRFFHEWTSLPPQRRDARPASPAPARGANAPAGEEPILGLFPEPER